MKKQVHRLAHKLQALLLRYHEEQGSLHQAPRAALDAWAALWAWHKAGEPVLRLTDEAEDALISHGLPADLHLATCQTARRGDAIMLQTPDRAHHVLAARLPLDAIIPVHGSVAYAYRGRILVYCIPAESLASGYHNLSDQPTPAALHLHPGTILRADGSTSPVADSDLMQDDYLATLAILALFTLPR